MKESIDSNSTIWMTYFLEEYPSDPVAAGRSLNENWRTFYDSVAEPVREVVKGDLTRLADETLGAKWEALRTAANHLNSVADNHIPTIKKHIDLTAAMINKISVNIAKRESRYYQFDRCAVYGLLILAFISCAHRIFVDLSTFRLLSIHLVRLT